MTRKVTVLKFYWLGLAASGLDPLFAAPSCIVETKRPRTNLNSLRPSEHICLGEITIIGSGNILSPGRRQAIILNNAGILLIGPLGTNLIEIQAFSSKKIRLRNVVNFVSGSVS